MLYYLHLEKQWRRVSAQLPKKPHNLGLRFDHFAGRQISGITSVNGKGISPTGILPSAGEGWPCDPPPMMEPCGRVSRSRS